MSKKPNLRAVPKVPQQKPVYANDIYADVRAASKDSERWRKMHERAHRRQPLEIFEPPHRRTWTDWSR